MSAACELTCPPRYLRCPAPTPSGVRRTATLTILAMGSAVLGAAVAWTVRFEPKAPPPPPPPPPPLRCDPDLYSRDVLTGKIMHVRGSKFIPMKDLLNESIWPEFGHVTSEYAGVAVPETIDYRDRDTPIKNQGACGSCWAHAFTQLVEWHLHNQTNRFSTLSEMGVTACASKQFTNGCFGAGVLSGVVLDYATTKRPIIPGDLYPYDTRLYGGFGDRFDASCIQCNVNASFVADSLSKSFPSYGPSAEVKTWGIATKECVDGICLDQNMTELALALAKYGPLIVMVDAGNWSTTYEGGGVFPTERCSSAANAMDHAVVLVGMTNDTWIVRNSWSSQWGDNGYIRLERKDGLNTCGIANQAIWLTIQPILYDDYNYVEYRQM